MPQLFAYEYSISKSWNCRISSRCQMMALVSETWMLLDSPCTWKKKTSGWLYGFCHFLKSFISNFSHLFYIELFKIGKTHPVSLFQAPSLEARELWKGYMLSIAKVGCAFEKILINTEGKISIEDITIFLCKYIC